MTDDSAPPVPDIISRLAQARGAGEAQGGLVRVVVDGTGDLVELTIAPRAMRLSSQDISEAVVQAFRAAREAAAETMQQAMADAPSGMSGDTGQLGKDLLRLGADAQRRLDEFAAVADQISRRLDDLGR